MSSETPPAPETPAPPTPGPRRGVGWVTLVLVAIASALVAGGAAYFLARRGAQATGTAQAPKAQYQCPMHPTIVKDRPGECPICGMKLVKVEPSGGGRPPREAPGERKLLYYRSPMDPRQTSPTPRKDAMGMDYVPVYADELEGQSSVQGFASVHIDPSRQQLIGLKTVAAQRGPVGGAWRTVGRVAVDETRVRHINLKIPAYVEHIYVNFVGKPVRKGEPLFSVYSPELVSAQEELLLALRTQRALAGSSALAEDGQALVAAARRKLELWDVPPPEIQRLMQTGAPMKDLTFYSPIAGVVTKKDVVEGMKLDAGAMPYEIVDLSKVWVFADVYESELRHVQAGMSATLTLKAFPSRVFTGSVSFIDPLLDPATRTVKVRLIFPNPSGELRPELFGEVILRGAARESLRVPADAIIESGTKSIVFVSLGEGKFQPREVQVGDSDGSYVEIANGLAEGEEVVTRANFLIDSESRLRASLAALGPGAGSARAGGHDQGAGAGSRPAQELQAEVPPAAPATGHGGRAPRISTQEQPAAAPPAAPAAREHAGHAAGSSPPAPEPPAESPPHAAPDHAEHTGHPGH